MTGGAGGTGPERCRRVDFDRINRTALASAESVVRALVGGECRRDGIELTCRNPLRPDKRLGSFRVNLSTGKWGDFAAGAAGGDLVSLAAYLSGMPQREAAIRLAQALGVPPWVN